jgi:hypothetical protein
MGFISLKWLVYFILARLEADTWMAVLTKKLFWEVAGQRHSYSFGQTVCASPSITRLIIA